MGTHGHSLGGRVSRASSHFPYSTPNHAANPLGGLQTYFCRLHCGLPSSCQRLQPHTTTCACPIRNFSSSSQYRPMRPVGGGWQVLTCATARSRAVRSRSRSETAAPVLMTTASPRSAEKSRPAKSACVMERLLDNIASCSADAQRETNKMAPNTCVISCGGV